MLRQLDVYRLASSLVEDNGGQVVRSKRATKESVSESASEADNAIMFNGAEEPDFCNDEDCLLHNNLAHDN